MAEQKETRLFGMTVKELAFICAIFGVGGGGTYVGQMLGHNEVDKKVDQVQLQEQIDTLQAQMARKFTKDAQELAVSMELGRMRGLEGQEAVEYVNGLMDFADAKIVDDSIWQTYYRPRLDALINRLEGACGYCIPGESLGELTYIDCLGQPKRVYYNHIGGSTKKVYYYRNDNDQVVVLRSMNPLLELNQ